MKLNNDFESFYQIMYSEKKIHPFTNNKELESNLNNKTEMLLEKEPIISKIGHIIRPISLLVSAYTFFRVDQSIMINLACLICGTSLLIAVKHSLCNKFKKNPIYWENFMISHKPDLLVAKFSFIIVLLSNICLLYSISGFNGILFDGILILSSHVYFALYFLGGVFLTLTVYFSLIIITGNEPLAYMLYLLLSLCIFIKLIVEFYITSSFITIVCISCYFLLPCLIYIQKKIFDENKKNIFEASFHNYIEILCYLFVFLNNFLMICNSLARNGIIEAKN